MYYSELTKRKHVAISPSASDGEEEQRQCPVCTFVHVVTDARIHVQYPNCPRCGLWLHGECDKVVLLDVKLSDYEDDAFVYECPLCRGVELEPAEELVVTSSRSTRTSSSATLEDDSASESDTSTSSSYHASASDHDSDSDGTFDTDRTQRPTTSREPAQKRATSLPSKGVSRSTFTSTFTIDTEYVTVSFLHRFLVYYCLCLSLFFFFGFECFLIDILAYIC